MPSTMSLRVGDDLLASAKVAADASGRSAAQQIGYWAKLGRELERSESVSVREITEVLAGARSYDDVGPKEQAVVRAEWAERIEERRAALNLAAAFAAEGRSWVEMSPTGDTIRHAATPPATTTGRRRTAEPRARKQAPAIAATKARGEGTKPDNAAARVAAGSAKKAGAAVDAERVAAGGRAAKRSSRATATKSATGAGQKTAAARKATTRAR